MLDQLDLRYWKLLKRWTWENFPSELGGIQQALIHHQEEQLRNLTVPSTLILSWINQLQHGRVRERREKSIGSTQPSLPKGIQFSLHIEATIPNNYVVLRHREFTLAFDAFLETPVLLTGRKYLLTGMRISMKMYFLIFQIRQLLLGSPLLSLGHGFRGLR